MYFNISLEKCFFLKQLTRYLARLVDEIFHKIVVSESLMKYFPDMTSNIDNNIKEFQRKEKVIFFTKIFKKISTQKTQLMMFVLLVQF